MGSKVDTTDERQEINLMRKIILLFISCLFIAALTGCSNSSDNKNAGIKPTAEPSVIYKEANDFYEVGLYDTALEQFSQLGAYENSAELADNCIIRIAEGMMNEGKYGEAISKYDSVKTIDVSEQIEECKYRNAVDMYNSDKQPAAVKIFKKIPDYKDSIEYIGSYAGILLEENKCDKAVELLEAYKLESKYSKIYNKAVDGIKYMNLATGKSKKIISEFYSVEYQKKKKVVLFRDKDLIEKNLKKYFYSTWYLFDSRDPVNVNDSPYFTINKDKICDKEYGVYAYTEDEEGNMNLHYYYKDEPESVYSVTIKEFYVCGIKVNILSSGCHINGLTGFAGRNNNTNIFLKGDYLGRRDSNIPDERAVGSFGHEEGQIVYTSVAKEELEKARESLEDEKKRAALSDAEYLYSEHRSSEFNSWDHEDYYPEELTGADFEYISKNKTYRVIFNASSYFNGGEYYYNVNATYQFKDNGNVVRCLYNETRGWK